MEWDRILEAMEGGTPVITANSRLAAELRRRFDALQMSRGHSAWPSPEVLPFTAWERNCWNAEMDARATGRTQEPYARATGRTQEPHARATGRTQEPHARATGRTQEPHARATGRTQDAPSHPSPILLSLRQAQWLWERTGQQLDETRGLLFPGGTVDLGFQAWERLQAWRLPIPVIESGASPEEVLFTLWAEAYAAHLQREGWVDPPQLPEQLLPLLGAGAIPLPDRLVLAGFDEHPPLREAIWETLRQAGVTIDPLDFPAMDGNVSRVTPGDAEAEAVLAARWARLRLEQNPGARIGIVVPNLSADRVRLARVFADVLTPGDLLKAPHPPTGSFNISKSPPLSDYPLVTTALWLLELTPGRHPAAHWRRLLHSPFVGGAEAEADARAAFDLRLRKRSTALAPAKVQDMAEGSSSAKGSAKGSMTAEGERTAEDKRTPTRTPLLAKHLDQWRLAFKALPTRQDLGGWVIGFGTLLDAWGWPGERTLDSAEHQTLMKWQEVLDELAKMASLVGEIGLTEARTLLGRILSEETFQPESGDAPVQILGELEAGGLTFDHLWVLGLHSEAWPSAPHPNPYLPLALQRQHGMPHASVTREAAVAKRLTDRLLASAPEVVVSHPRQDGDRTLHVSPLIRHLPEVVPGALPASDDPPLRATIAAAAAPESYRDDRGPALEEGVTHQGGTSLFRDQSACPFRAFATHRLHAKPIEDAVEGLDAADRGTLVHRVLDLAWEGLGDHAHLAALSEDALGDFCARTVEKALSEEFDRRLDLEGNRLRSLEQRRLTALLKDWLLTEKDRPPFAVESREVKRDFDLGGISVTGRVDRIDRLPDGGRIVMDYKTGRASLAQWSGERPDEPQLPLYCASEATPPVGVAFARVRKGAFAFVGLANDPGVLPGTKDMAKQLSREIEAMEGGSVGTFGVAPEDAADDPAARMIEVWSTHLNRLGEAFRNGEARVDPKHRGRSCAYCGLDALCRIAEREGGAVEDVEDGNHD